MIRFLFCALLCISVDLSVNGQNLVANHSFEDVRLCPTTLDQLRFTRYWIGSGTADPSPDLFNRCAEAGMMGVPYNYFGNQEPKTGDGYAGLISYLKSKSGKSWKLKANHREFLVTNLLKPLDKDKEYYLEVSVSLAENCEFAIGNFGMLLSKNAPPIDWMPIEMAYFKPQITNDPSVFLDKKGEWTTISGIYKAKGGESILTIGNFDADKITSLVKNEDGQNIFAQNMQVAKKDRPRISYYFVDDVIVRPVIPEEPVFVADVTPEESEPEPEPIKSEYFGDIEEGDKIVLDNIYFEFDQSVLLPASYSELNELGSFLVQNPTVRIQISGHTDNIGTAEYNLRLSQDRAAAVMSYLTVNGIDQGRLVSRGFGSEYPIDTNNSEEGRSKNRRVEFELISSN
ncbi:MAG: OmpA family protein [Bacteroidota bacterium]